MNTKTRRDRNENFIEWDAVATHGLFTPCAPVVWTHESLVVFARGKTVPSESQPQSLDERHFSGNVEVPDDCLKAKDRALTHDEMLAMAKTLRPPQDWFDEDLTGLRRPRT